MSLTKEATQKTIKEFAVNEKDTGSPEVQVALLTQRINNLSLHLQKNKKDLHSRVGLMKQVSQRKSLLNYLKNKNYDRYAKLIESLGLRK